MRAFAPTGTRASSDSLTLQGDAVSREHRPARARHHHHRPPRADRQSRSARQPAATCSARWRRAARGGSDLQLRAYFDRTHRDDPSFRRRSRHRSTWSCSTATCRCARHEIVWGLNYRYTDNTQSRQGDLRGRAGRLARPAVRRLRPGPVRDLGRAAADASARSSSTTTSAASRCSPACGSRGMSRPARTRGRPCRAPCACRRDSSATSPIEVDSARQQSARGPARQRRLRVRRAARVRSWAIAGSRSRCWHSTWRCSTTATKGSRRWSSARRRSIRAPA